MLADDKANSKQYTTRLRRIMGPTPQRVILVERRSRERNASGPTLGCAVRALRGGLGLSRVGRFREQDLQRRLRRPRSPRPVPGCRHVGLQRRGDRRTSPPSTKQVYLLDRPTRWFQTPSRKLKRRGKSP